MSDQKRSEELLSQILEVQRQHLEEYKRVTSQSLEMQRRGVEAQARHVGLYRWVIGAGGLIAAGLLIYLVWLSRLLP